MHFKNQTFYKTFFTGLGFLRRSSFLLLFIGSVLGFSNSVGSRESSAQQEKRWVGTWSTAPQLVEPRNMPPEPGLSNNSLRQIVRVSLGGDSLRIRFSNEFSSNPTVLRAVEIATSEGAGAIDTSTTKKLTFNGESKATIDPEEAITSDPVSFDLKSREDLAITIHFGATPEDLTGHPGSRTTSYIIEGDHTSTLDFPGAVKTDHWYIISGIDVQAPDSAAAVAILGNSITDGRGSGTNKQNRWPDILAERLLKNPETQQIGVLNQGIGGNAVLRGGLGPTGLERFERDILNQHRVGWLIILEGVNDLGSTKDSAAAFQVAKDLVLAYEEMIEEAHAQGIKVYGGTITPIKESFYYTDYREAARDSVNDWIRSSGKFDAVIDFDRTIRDPKNPSTILPEAHSGDYLHPNEVGYQMMGRAIDLSLFE